MKCERCKGDGIVEKHIPGYEGVPEKDIMVVCPDCEGSGEQEDFEDDDFTEVHIRKLS